VSLISTGEDTAARLKSLVPAPLDLFSRLDGPARRGINELHSRGYELSFVRTSSSSRGLVVPSQRLLLWLCLRDFEIEALHLGGVSCLGLTRLWTDRLEIDALLLRVEALRFTLALKVLRLKLVLIRQCYFWVRWSLSLLPLLNSEVPLTGEVGVFD